MTDSSQLSDAVQQQFQGFTYQASEAIAGSMVSGSLMGPNRIEAAVAGSFAPRQAGGIRR